LFAWTGTFRNTRTLEAVVLGGKLLDR